MSVLQREATATGVPDLRAVPLDDIGLADRAYAGMMRRLFGSTGPVTPVSAFQSSI